MVDVVWLDAGADCPAASSWCVHHVVVDGVSLRLLSDDLASAWTDVASRAAGLTRQRGHAVSAVGRRAACRHDGRHVRRRRGLLAERRRRRSRADDRQQAARPGGRRGRHRGQAGGRASVRTSRAACSARSRTRFAAASTTSWSPRSSLALAEWRGSESSSLLLELEGHGREAEHLGAAGEHLDLSRTLGWFTTLFPVSVDPGATPWDRLMSGGRGSGRRRQGGQGAAACGAAQRAQLRCAALSFGPAAARPGGPAAGAVQLPRPVQRRRRRTVDASPRTWSPRTAIPGCRCRGPSRSTPSPWRPTTARTLEATFSWPAGVLDRQRMEALRGLWVDALTAIAASDAVSRSDPVGLPARHAHAGRRRRAPGASATWSTSLPPSPLQGGHLLPLHLRRRRPVRRAADRRAGRSGRRRAPARGRRT